MSSQVYQSVAKAAIALSRSHSSSHRLISSSNGILGRLQATPSLKNNLMIQPCAYISKNADKKTTIAADMTPATKLQDAVSTAAPAKKNWVSFGFSYTTEEDDLNNRNGIMFFMVTIGMVGTSFFLAYFPDYRLRNWYQREAYVELARREAMGLPQVDPNLIPPENFSLPSEEELEDFEIII